ncbi:MAG: ATP-binding cassette domain-containing protein [Syntrophomonadaceae bacterium]|jgi:ABC-type lipoprotein export system ATPase subunit
MNDYRISQIIKQYPPLKGFLENMGLPLENIDLLIEDYLRLLDDLLLEEVGLKREELFEIIESYLHFLQEINEQKDRIESLTIQGGEDKSGNNEDIAFNVKVGEIVCIVGPTGSGKSRLLEDIEWMTQGDTPTKRKVLINGADPGVKSRFSYVQRPVAQLSQNMNFVMDITVGEFIKMHAESRMMENIAYLVDVVVNQANLLCGERIHKEMPLTSLSGGQSRALMIADTASVSISPIVLIDEIENAGINRKTALELLIKHDKIVFIATHDPILALMGHKRLVMQNGGMARIIDRTAKEQAVLQKLEIMDSMINEVRQILREGHSLDEIEPLALLR